MYVFIFVALYDTSGRIYNYVMCLFLHTNLKITCMFCTCAVYCLPVLIVITDPEYCPYSWLMPSSNEVGIAHIHPHNTLVMYGSQDYCSRKMHAWITLGLGSYSRRASKSKTDNNFLLPIQIWNTSLYSEKQKNLMLMKEVNTIFLSVNETCLYM